LIKTTRAMAIITKIMQERNKIEDRTYVYMEGKKSYQTD
jgi:hypothetical protein